MSSESPTIDEHAGLDKGKAKAKSPEATEHTPLLASQSFTSHDDLETTTRARRTLVSKLVIVFLTSLAVCIVVFVIVALIAYSYAGRISNVSPDYILDNALVVKGPDRINVLNITENGEIWVEVKGRVGLDAGSVMGVNSDDDHDGFLTSLWKSMGRWGVQRLDRISVNLTTIQVTSKHKDTTYALASLDTPPLDLPLTTDPPADYSWLTSVSIPLLISPTHNFTLIKQFARDAWQDGTIMVKTSVERVVIRGGALNENSWRQNLKAERSDILTDIRMKIPTLPGLPTPGHHFPFPPVSQLITLQSYNLTSQSDGLLLAAHATAINPAPLSINFTSPPLPFVVSLSTGNQSTTSVPVASVMTEPFSLTHPNITLTITGKALPPSSSSSPILSAFLTNYLSELPNPIVITSPLFPNVTLDAVFPAPHPRPEVLRDVTIHNMKIKPSAGGAFLASGTVFARVVLPPGINVNLNIKQILPDVLVFDGEVPDVIPPISHPDGDVPAPPLPDPLPDRAFAHIRPNDWLQAISMPDVPQESEGSVFTVTAKVADVPLEVLPGRQREFSSFVRKILFGSQGAMAGIQGSAAVAVAIQGLPIGHGDQIELTRLPFRGRVLIGKKTLFEQDMKWWRRTLSRLSWRKSIQP